MARILNEVKVYGEVKLDGIIYRFRFNEVRKKVGQYWSLVARFDERTGEWEVF